MFTFFFLLLFPFFFFLLFFPTSPGKSTRAIVLARWGGLGTHRYQVGFSGDVRPMNWDTLAYQPYFSQTAANVAYGFWSHDIEGPGNDPEMYVRWMQWAAFSGVLRSHDRGMSAGSCAGDEPGQGKRGGRVSMVVMLRNKYTNRYLIFLLIIFMLQFIVRCFDFAVPFLYLLTISRCS